MIRSTDGLIRHAKTVKSKLMFFLFENTYTKIRKTREDLQHQVKFKMSVDSRVCEATRG